MPKLDKHQKELDTACKYIQKALTEHQLRVPIDAQEHVHQAYLDLNNLCKEALQGVKLIHNAALYVPPTILPFQPVGETPQERSARLTRELDELFRHKE